jgi:hypothetical protein
MTTDRSIVVQRDGSTELWENGRLLTTGPSGGNVDVKMAEVFTPDALPPLEAWRFEAAMLTHGLAATVNAAIASMPEPARSIATAKRARSIEYHRDDPLVMQISAAAGLSPGALDALWREAMGY